MSLLAVGISHQTAPVALLEQFAMAADDRVKALHELVASDHVSEALVLATCNRIEVFAEVERFHGGVADVSRVLARQAGATVEELSPYVTVHYEDQAVSHLFTVAAGLDSMVVGETQVLGQLRAAYALAREEGTVGRALHPVAQRALRVGKRVHTETGIDRAGASLVSVALDRAEERIGDAAAAARCSSSAPARWAPSPRPRWPAAAPRSSSAAAPTAHRRPAGRRAWAAAPRRWPSCRRSSPPPTCWSRAPGRPGWWSHTDVVAEAMAARGGRAAGRRRPGPAPGRRPGRRRAAGRARRRPGAAAGRASRHPAGHARVRRRRRHRRGARHGRDRDRAAARRAPGRRGGPDGLRAAQPGRRGRRGRAAAAVHPAARPRRPRAGRDRPHRAPRRRQAAARADGPGEGAGRRARRHRLRRRPARPLRARHRRAGRRRGALAERGHRRPRPALGEAS